jgi:hypothetical protein
MLDVYDWIVGNNYPRQEHLESLRAVDATANLGAESTVGATANLGAESTVGAVHDGPLDSHPDMGVPAVRNTGPTFQATNPSAPSTALVRSRDPPSYLKDCPKTSGSQELRSWRPWGRSPPAIEMEADWQRETRLIAARPNPLIRQPRDPGDRAGLASFARSLLLSGWTETHPESGSVCITSHVRSHEEF